MQLYQCTRDRTLWKYRVAEKWHHILYALTLPIIMRFSKLFHYQNQEKICNNTITKDPTTPQVCRYTTCKMSRSPQTAYNRLDLSPGCLGPHVRLHECDVLTPQVSAFLAVYVSSTAGLSTSTIRDNQPAEDNFLCYYRSHLVFICWF